MKLWGFQADLLARSDAAMDAGCRAVCWQLPTGTGKTVTATAKIKDVYDRGGKTLILAHRQLICDQFLEKAVDAGLGFDVSLIRPRHVEMAWQPIWIGNIQTVNARLSRTRIEPDCIIVDECHHIAAKTHQRVLARWPGADIIAMSATPERLDGKPLKPLKTLIQGPSPRWCIEHSYLSDYDAFSFDAGVHREDAKLRGGDYDLGEQQDHLAAEGGKVMSNVRRAANKYLSGRRWIAFGPTIQASQTLCEDLERDGFKCAHVDGKMTDGQITAVMRRFKEGLLDGICSVQLIDEGVDCPWADAILIYRDTASLVRYLQMCGRVLRYLKGKRALIVDTTGVCRRHGAPCVERPWSLEGKIDRRSSGDDLKVCYGCYRYIPRNWSRCSHCGQVFEGKGTPAKPRIEVDTELTKLEIPGAGIIRVRPDPQSEHGVERSDLNRALWQAWTGGGAEGIMSLANQLRKGDGWAEWWIEFIQGKTNRSQSASGS